ncbi:MAG: hypothetical protein ACN4E2_07575 [Nitrospinota bacterium]
MEDILHELHELTGVIGFGLLIIISVSGLALRFFQSIRNFVNRQNIFLGHKSLAILLVAIIVAHVLTSDDRHIVLYIAILALAVMFILSVSPLLKRNLKLVVNIKIALLLFAALALVYGHDVVEDHGDHDHDKGKITDKLNDDDGDDDDHDDDKK